MQTPRLPKRLVLFILLGALVVISCDQASKFAAMHFLSSGSPHFLIGHTVSLELVSNRGIAFGLPASLQIILLLLLGPAIIILKLYSLRASKAPLFTPLYASGWMRVAAALGLGGAIGNGIDRSHLGYVVDFIRIGFWPVFNVADIALTLAVLIMVKALLFRKTETPTA
jgi:signal peptidase II